MSDFLTAELERAQQEYDAKYGAQSKPQVKPSTNSLKEWGKALGGGALDALKGGYRAMQTYGDVTGRLVGMAPEDNPASRVFKQAGDQVQKWSAPLAPDAEYARKHPVQAPVQGMVRAVAPWVALGSPAIRMPIAAMGLMSGASHEAELVNKLTDQGMGSGEAQLRAAPASLADAAIFAGMGKASEFFMGGANPATGAFEKGLIPLAPPKGIVSHALREGSFVAPYMTSQGEITQGLEQATGASTPEEWKQSHGIEEGASTGQNAWNLLKYEGGALGTNFLMGAGFGGFKGWQEGRQEKGYRKFKEKREGAAVQDTSHPVDLTGNAPTLDEQGVSEKPIAGNTPLINPEQRVELEERARQANLVAEEKARVTAELQAMRELQESQSQKRPGEENPLESKAGEQGQEASPLTLQVLSSKTPEAKQSGIDSGGESTRQAQLADSGEESHELAHFPENSEPIKPMGPIGKTDSLLKPEEDATKSAIGKTDNPIDKNDSSWEDIPAIRQHLIDEYGYSKSAANRLSRENVVKTLTELQEREAKGEDVRTPPARKEIHQTILEAAKRINDSIGNSGRAQVAPEYLHNAVMKLSRSVKDFAEFSRGLVQRFGDAVKSHALKLWNWAKNVQPGLSIKSVDENGNRVPLADTVQDLRQSEFEKKILKEKSVWGIPVRTSFSIRSKSGEPIHARYDRENGVIEYNPKLTRDKFLEKAWTRTRTYSDGSKPTPFPEETFKDLGEWIDYTIRHEFAHHKYDIEPGENNARYEDRLNAMVLKSMGKSFTPATVKSQAAPTKSEAKPKQLSLFGEDQREVPEQRYAPDSISSLKPNQVFVFGSNTEGRHGMGAAKTAREKFGAKYGQAEGEQGQSYAIVTKDLRKGNRSIPLEEIGKGIDRFLEHAKTHPEKEFLATKLGSSLAGYSEKEIGDLFRAREIPENVKLPKAYAAPATEKVATDKSGIKVISGGQSGADLAGVDAAKDLGIATGGTAAHKWSRYDDKGKKITDPSLAEKYGMVEGEGTPVSGQYGDYVDVYRHRTLKNAQDADGTIWFGNPESPGGRLTLGRKAQEGKPKPLVNPESAQEIREWLQANGIRTLNVAGNREHTNPGIYQKAKELLKEALAGEIPTAGRGPAAGTPVTPTPERNPLKRVTGAERSRIEKKVGSHVEYDGSNAQEVARDVAEREKQAELPEESRDPRAMSLSEGAEAFGIEDTYGEDQNHKIKVTDKMRVKKEVPNPARTEDRLIAQIDRHLDQEHSEKLEPFKSPLQKKVERELEARRERERAAQPPEIDETSETGYHVLFEKIQDAAKKNGGLEKRTLENLQKKNDEALGEAFRELARNRRLDEIDRDAIRSELSALKEKGYPLHAILEHLKREGGIRLDKVDVFPSKLAEITDQLLPERKKVELGISKPAGRQNDVNGKATPEPRPLKEVGDGAEKIQLRPNASDLAREKIEGEKREAQLRYDIRMKQPGLSDRERDQALRKLQAANTELEKRLAQIPEAPGEQGKGKGELEKERLARKARIAEERNRQREAQLKEYRNFKENFTGKEQLLSDAEKLVEAMEVTRTTGKNMNSKSWDLDKVLLKALGVTEGSSEVERNQARDRIGTLRKLMVLEEGSREQVKVSREEALRNVVGELVHYTDDILGVERDYQGPAIGKESPFGSPEKVAEAIEKGQERNAPDELPNLKPVGWEDPDLKEFLFLENPKTLKLSPEQAKERNNDFADGSSFWGPDNRQFVFDAKVMTKEGKSYVRRMDWDQVLKQLAKQRERQEKPIPGDILYKEGKPELFNKSPKPGLDILAPDFTREDYVPRVRKMAIEKGLLLPDSEMDRELQRAIDRKDSNLLRKHAIFLKGELLKQRVNELRKLSPEELTRRAQALQEEGILVDESDLFQLFKAAGYDVASYGTLEARLAAEGSQVIADAIAGSKKPYQSLESVQRRLAEMAREKRKGKEGKLPESEEIKLEQPDLPGLPMEKQLPPAYRTRDQKLAAGENLPPEDVFTAKEPGLPGIGEELSPAEQKIHDMLSKGNGAAVIGEFRDRVAQRVYSQLAKVFGAELVVVRDQTGDFKGGYFPNQKTPVIAVNADAGISFTRIFAHELFHHVVNRIDPASYARFTEALREAVDEPAWNRALAQLKAREQGAAAWEYRESREPLSGINSNERYGGSQQTEELTGKFPEGKHGGGVLRKLWGDERPLQGKPHSQVSPEELFPGEELKDFQVFHGDEGGTSERKLRVATRGESPNKIAGEIPDRGKLAGYYEDKIGKLKLDLFAIQNRMTGQGGGKPEQPVLGKERLVMQRQFKEKNRELRQLEEGLKSVQRQAPLQERTVKSATGVKPLSEAERKRYEEELHSEIFAQAFQRPEFWESLNRSSEGRNLARNLLIRGMKNATRVLQFFKSLDKNQRSIHEVKNLVRDWTGEKTDDGVYRLLSQVLDEAYLSKTLQHRETKNFTTTDVTDELKRRGRDTGVILNDAFRRAYPKGTRGWQEITDAAGRLLKHAVAWGVEHMPKVAYQHVGKIREALELAEHLKYAPRYERDKAMLQVVKRHEGAWDGLSVERQMKVVDDFVRGKIDVETPEGQQRARALGYTTEQIEFLRDARKVADRVFQKLVEIDPELAPRYFKEHYGLSIKWRKNADGMLLDPDLDAVLDPEYSKLTGSAQFLKGKELKLSTQQIMDRFDLKADTFNPEELFLNYVQDAYRYIAFHETIGRASELGLAAYAGNQWEAAQRGLFPTSGDAALKIMQRVNVAAGWKVRTGPDEFFQRKSQDVVFASRKAAEEALRETPLTGFDPVIEKVVPDQTADTSYYAVEKVSTAERKDRATGEPVLDKNGKPVTGEKREELRSFHKNNEAGARVYAEALPKSPGVRYEVRPVQKAPEQAQAGQLFFHKDLARLLNQILARDLLRSSPKMSALMDLKNGMTGIELSLSLYHALTETHEMVASGAQHAIMRQILNKGGRMRNLSVADWGNAFNPVKLKREQREISTILEEVLADPRLASDQRVVRQMDQLLGTDGVNLLDILDAGGYGGLLPTGQDRSLKSGGDKIGRMKYRSREDQILFRPDHIAVSNNPAFQAKAFIGSFEKAWRDTAKQYPDSPLTAALKTAKFSVMEGPTAWLMEQAIPKIKFAQFAKEYTYQLDRQRERIEADPAAKKEIAREVIAFVEDRFGEKNWDTMWMDPSMKSTMQFTFRSYSWAEGTAKALGKSAIDFGKWGWFNLVKGGIGGGKHRYELTDKGWWGIAALAVHVATATALRLAYQAVNGIMGTDEVPDDPETSPLTKIMFVRSDPYDPHKYLALPGYATEAYKIALHLGLTGAPAEPSKLVTGRFNSFLANAVESYNNETWRGERVGESGAMGLLPRALHLFNLAPISFSNVAKESREKGFSPLTIPRAFLGMNDAPAAARRSPAVNLAYAIRREEFSGKKLTSEQFEEKDLLKRAMYRYQQGDRSEVERMLKEGEISQQEFLHALSGIPTIDGKRNGLYVDDLTRAFKGLTIEGKLKVWEVMSEAEKKRERPALMKAFISVMGRQGESRQQKEKLREEFKKLSLM